MDRKKELKQQFKEIKVDAGVYQIRNKLNNKIFVTSTPNLKTLNGRRFELDSGKCPMNSGIQTDLKEFGPQAFEIEILEALEEKDEPDFNRKKALKELEEKWLDKLQPYGERGYNHQRPDKQ
ncbi:MAG: GIY-YIG nuclease family protein [Bacillota bacterium]|nr:GIY-YIG nuclease family protein [Bacillota bacterium]